MLMINLDMQCADCFDAVLQPSRSCHYSADYVPLCEGPIGILIHSRGAFIGSSTNAEACIPGFRNGVGLGRKGFPD